MLKVFYIECSGAVWLKIALEAQRQAGWKPILWTAATADLQAVRQAFPGVHCQEGDCATRGIPISTLNCLEVRALGCTILRELAPEESIIFQMMDRMDPTGVSFTLEERRYHYYQLLQYWDSVLDHLKPDVIVFSIAPHVVFDYVLYVLAKRKGIPTRMFERLGIPGWVYAISDIFETPFNSSKSLSVAPPALNPEFRQYYFKTASGGKKAIPPNFMLKLNRLGIRENSRLSSARATWFEVKRATAIIRKFGFGEVKRNYQKLPKKAPENSQPRVWHVLRTRWRSLILKQQSRKMLSKLIRTPDRDAPFVLLALHFQPERATVPMGGVMGDQTLIADMLALALNPIGWNVLVKEHAWQLSTYSRSEALRTPAFYKRIDRHSNVYFATSDADTSALIDSARAVATVTGSVGWQAICRGVPALVFGAAWYRECPGAFSVCNPRDIDAAISDIARNFEISQEAVQQFLAMMQSVCVRGYLEVDVEAVAAMNDAEIAGSMANALIAGKL